MVATAPDRDGTPAGLHAGGHESSAAASDGQAGPDGEPNPGGFPIIALHWFGRPAQTPDPIPHLRRVRRQVAATGAPPPLGARARVRVRRRGQNLYRIPRDGRPGGGA
jgi:hypothetical protein